VTPKSVALTVHENSSPLIRLRLRVPDEHGDMITRDLSAVQALRLYLKDSPDAPDPAPTYQTGQGITMEDPRSGGWVRIQFAASDLQTPGNRFFRIDGQTGSTSTPFVYGRLHIINA
jgi:hypothetical protein